jgi:hypothetical protein
VRRWHGWQAVAFWSTVAVILPIASMTLIRTTISTAGADPSFYLGYLVDRSTHIARFGQTYHGNRISYLLVDGAFFRFLSPESAFYVSRTVMLAVATVASALIGRRFGGRTTGLLAAASIAFVPWLPRQLLWTHYDGFATVYLLVAVALLIVPTSERSRRWAEVAAGIAFAAAVNANLAIVAVVATLVPGWLLFRAYPGVRPTARAVGRVGAGFVGASLLVASVLNRLYPDGEAFPELVALRVGLDVLSSDTWFVPLSALGASVAFMLIVPALVAVLIAARPTEASVGRDLVRLTRLAVVHLSLLAVLALVLHFQFKNTWISASYYTIYHLPGVLLGLVALLGAWVHRTTEGARARSAAIAILALVVWYALLPLPAGVGTVALLVAAVAVLALLVASQAPAGRIAAATPVLLVALFLGFTASPWHSGAPGSARSVAEREAFEWDVFRHSVELKRLVEASTAVDERVLFWHANAGVEGDWLTRLNMVFYGTGEGRLHGKSNPVGMPSLTEGEEGALREERPLVLILMAPTGGEILAGMVALEAAGHRYVQRELVRFDGAAIDVHLAVLEIP